MRRIESIIKFGIGLFCMVMTISASSQTYFHPTTGLQNTFAGACAVNGCGGVYYDNGGPSGDYAYNVSNIYRTFCPDVPGQCIQLSFTSFDLEPEFGGICYDSMQINNGPTQNSPTIWHGCGTTSPGVITSTDASGCITVRFASDGIINAGGWAANISCVPCAGAGPSETLNTDCINGEYVCDNLQPISANSQGPGLTSETCNSGCVVSENYSNWYILNITQAGSFNFTINPTPFSADYDFALYGPVVGGCGNLGSPIRCSYAANIGPTGMRPSSFDFSEDVTGDGWVNSANVVIGTYYLMVNQWSYAPNSQFQLDFSTGTSTIGLPTPVISSNTQVCDNAPLQLTGFAAPGATYTWSGPGGWTATTVDAIRDPAVAGTYSFYYTVNGCNSPLSTLNVTADPAPVAAITPAASTVCNGSSVTLDASGGDSYVWSNSATTQSITVSPLTNTVYTVTATDANGCTATASSTVSIGSGSPASISPAAPTICEGENIVLTASTGASYNWNNAEVTQSITVSPTTTTVYTVTVTDAGGCTATDSVTVNVNALPTATVTPSDTAICEGEAVTLQGGGGVNYEWDNNATTASITVSPLTNTVYTVTATDANGCTATALSTVSIGGGSPASISPAAPTICEGESIMLTASTGASYAWNNAEVTQSITVSPSITTVYTVTVTDAGSCTATDSVTVNVNPLPTATVTPSDTAICEGEAVTLQAGGGVSYEWDNNATTQSITVSPLINTVYTVTATDANGCTATASSTVSIGSGSPASISPAAPTICEGENIVLTASAGASYNWNNAEVTQSITVSPSITTVYTVTVTDAGGCTATAAGTVNVNALPTATVTPSDTAICEGEAVTLQAGGGVSYEWDNNATTASITVSPLINTVYTVTATDANGCTATASSTVSIGGGTPASISPAAPTICEGENVVLTASAGASYNWNNAEVTQSITVSPTTTTVYTVTVTDAGSCTATASVTVNVNALPTATVTPSDTVVCEGEDVILQGGGGVNYEWNNNATTVSITVSPLTNTVYTVTATDANGCTATASSTVSIGGGSPASISPAAPTICEGESIMLTASAGASYNWNNTEVTQSITVSPTTTTVYTVTVTDAGSCTATDSVTVNVNALPTATVTPFDTAICEGENVTLQAGGGVSYEWDNNATTGSITVSPLINTVYTVTATDANGCTSTASSTVSIGGSSPASISPTAPTICEGENIVLTASAGASYAWNNAEVTQSITVSPTTTTVYTVTVTDAGGCTVTASVTVNVNALPTATVTPSDTAICEGEAVTLQAGGGVSYEWDNNATTSSITVSPSTTTTYSVTVTDAAGCRATATGIVNVNALPVVLISPVDTNICGGQSVTLTATGGVAYNWSNNVTGSPITVNPFTTTTYRVTATDANGCTADASTGVIVTPSITLSVAVTDVMCNGDSDGAIDLTVTGGQSPFDYLWSNGAPTQNISGISAGSYSVTVNDAVGCGATIDTVVAEPPVIDLNESHTHISCNGEGDGSITLSVSGGTMPYSFLWNDSITAQHRTGLVAGSYAVTLSDGNQCEEYLHDINITEPAPLVVSEVVNDVRCYGDDNGAIDVSSVSGGNPPYAYVWSDANNDAVRTGLAPGNYSVTITDDNLCAVVFDTTLAAPLEITISASLEDPTCMQNGDDGNISLTAGGGEPPLQYNWAHGPTASVLHDLSPGMYDVVVTDDNNCSTTASFSLSYQYNFSVDASEAVTIETGASTELDYAISGNPGSYTVVWSPDGSLDCNDCDHPEATPLTTTVYYIEVTNDEGCAALDSVEVRVVISEDIIAPNVFTPNNDGDNDDFQILGNLDAITSMDAAIFNRWGEKIYGSKDPYFQWNGKSNGEILPPDVYVYQIRFTTTENPRPKTLKGSVTLIR